MIRNDWSFSSRIPTTINVLKNSYYSVYDEKLVCYKQGRRQGVLLYRGGEMPRCCTTCANSPEKVAQRGGGGGGLRYIFSDLKTVVAQFS